MEDCKKGTYSGKIRRRIRIQYLVLAAMLIYMPVIVELGGGDSRIMTKLARNFSTLIYFGGLFYMIAGIRRNKKILANRILLKEQRQTEQDERNRYLHDKSGGLVLDILLVCLLFFTWTASLFHMAVFYTLFSVLILAGGLKAAFYYYYSNTGR